MIKTFIKTHIIDYAVKLILENVTDHFYTTEIPVVYLMGKKSDDHLIIDIPHMNMSVVILYIYGDTIATSSNHCMIGKTPNAIHTTIPLKIANKLDEICIHIISESFPDISLTKNDIIIKSMDDYECLLKQ